MCLISLQCLTQLLDASPLTISIRPSDLNTSKQHSTRMGVSHYSLCRSSSFGGWLWRRARKGVAELKPFFSQDLLGAGLVRMAPVLISTMELQIYQLTFYSLNGLPFHIIISSSSNGFRRHTTILCAYIITSITKNCTTIVAV